MSDLPHAARNQDLAIANWVNPRAVVMVVVSALMVRVMLVVVMVGRFFHDLPPNHLTVFDRQDGIIRGAPKVLGSSLRTRSQNAPICGLVNW